MVSGLFPVVWEYMRANLRSIVISAIFSLTGTGLSTYGFFKHDALFLWIGPVVAMIGKVIVGTIILFPIVKRHFSPKSTTEDEIIEELPLDEKYI